jgi:hypothetical protein
LYFVQLGVYDCRYRDKKVVEVSLCLRFFSCTTSAIIDKIKAYPELHLG